MARARRKKADPATAGPDIGEDLALAEVPWLAPQRAQLLASLGEGRLPHGLLLCGQPQAGQGELAVWLAALLLCDAPAEAACGSCTGCKLFLAGTHPDFHRVGIEPETRGVLVDQIRGLTEALVTRSYRGGRKAAVIDPADMMNINASNSLLKTLEEPSEDTFLILCASRLDRMPATIVSRCARVGLGMPECAEGLAWLREQESDAPWERLLELAYGSPLGALSLAAEGMAEIDGEMTEAVSAALQGRLDILGTAKRWSDAAPAARLAWLRGWLEAHLRAASLGAPPSDLVDNNRVLSLPGPSSNTMIRAGYRLLGQVQDAAMQLSGSLNRQLLFEGLVIELVEFARQATRE